ncbi:Hsp20/alpha crystallin family protein [Nesterenkonia aurantiaca]|uniref:Hsp20/alpha crystallin family protein n=1 Tax=Nesterenkonia aurantiaca TaxID=1436010 RepID=A0A4R7G0U8_9MICC|nr:Hsp20/alpha crystallin family protein [Nesterenkonia aurantiaca]TDS84686.1 Hsp20/alpha crystallin family protein [Nesterenkonia aurantiaca]
MAETLVRRDPITGAEVPRCDLPEDVILRALRGKLHTIHLRDEPGEGLVIEAMLPNFDASDITIDVHQGELSIRAEHDADGEGTQYLVRGGSSFYRRVTLPSGAQQDLICADFQDGTLRVTIPVSDPTSDRASDLRSARPLVPLTGRAGVDVLLRVHPEPPPPGGHNSVDPHPSPAALEASHEH